LIADVQTPGRDRRPDAALDLRIDRRLVVGIDEDERHMH
jgi:hypothetical protein